MSKNKVHYINPIAKYCKLRDRNGNKNYSEFLWYYTCGLIGYRNWKISEGFEEVTCLKCIKDEEQRGVGFKAGRGYKRVYVTPPMGVLWVDRVAEIRGR